MMHKLTVEIYENEDTYPIVTHIFRGHSSKAVWGTLQAHMKTDVFLRSAVNYQSYKDIPLVVRTFYMVK